jgi:hypothetical protein
VFSLILRVIEKAVVVEKHQDAVFVFVVVVVIAAPFKKKIIENLKSICLWSSKNLEMFNRSLFPEL